MARCRSSLARLAPAFAAAASPAGRRLTALTTAQRSALIHMLGGPLQRRPRGWSAGTSRHAVVDLRVIASLTARGLAVIRPAQGKVALTDDGYGLAVTLGAEHEEMLAQARRAVEAWLIDRAAPGAGAASPLRRRLAGAPASALAAE